MSTRDTAWKHLFALPAMVEHLLRGFAPELAAHLDFDSLAQLSPVWTAAGHEQRLSDDAWRIGYADGSGRSLVLLIEFQSATDPRMAMRMRRYDGMARERLRRQRWLDPDGELRTLPVVIYSGARRWTAPGAASRVGVDADGELLLPAPWTYLLLDARRLPVDYDARNLAVAVLSIENAPTLAAAAAGLRAMAGWLPEMFGGEDARQVLESVMAWLSPTLARLFPAGGAAAAVAALRRELLGSEEEDGKMTTLAQRVRKWEAEFVREGRREGRQEGRREGRQEGLREGRQEGLRQGLAAERALLRRQATRRFGADAGAELGRRLEGMADPERFAEVGDWIIECATGAELLARFGPSREPRAQVDQIE